MKLSDYEHIHVHEYLLTHLINKTNEETNNIYTCIYIYIFFFFFFVVIYSIAMSDQSTLTKMTNSHASSTPLGSVANTLSNQHHQKMEPIDYTADESMIAVS